MALIEKVWNDWVGQAPSLKFDPVEVAQIDKSSSVWFGEVPENAYEDEKCLRNQVCRSCTLYSESEGDFINGPDLKQIIVEGKKCTGIYLHSDDSIPFRKGLWLQAVAPRGTFSRPDPRAICATLKARP